MGLKSQNCNYDNNDDLDNYYSNDNDEKILEENIKFDNKNNIYNNIYNNKMEFNMNDIEIDKKLDIEVNELSDKENFKIFQDIQHIEDIQDIDQKSKQKIVEKNSKSIVQNKDKKNKIGNKNKI